MSQYLTSEDLIESIKRRASVPENQVTFTKDDFLELANEEMSIGLVPSVLQFHEDFFLYEEEIQLQPNVNEYTIPYRSIGNKLRDVQYKLTDGHYLEMTRIGIGERFENNNNYNNAGGNHRFYVKNNKIVISSFGNPLNGALAMIYYIRPSRLVLKDQVGIISGINRTTGDVTIQTVPDKFNTNIKYDFYKFKSPFRILSIDLSATSINKSTKTIRFNPSEIPSDLEVGDHLAESGESNIPQIPIDLHVVLAHRVACRILEAIGDTQGLQNANQKLVEMEMKTGNLIDNRVEDAPKKVVNRHSTLRRVVSANRFTRR